MQVSTEMVKAWTGRVLADLNGLMSKHVLPFNRRSIIILFSLQSNGEVDPDLRLAMPSGRARTHTAAALNDGSEFVLYPLSCRLQRTAGKSEGVKAHSTPTRSGRVDGIFACEPPSGDREMARG